MRTAIEILLAVVTSGVGVAGVILFSVRRRLHRFNRLVAARRSAAPAAWVWSPRRAPMLHRRLRACCQVASEAAAAAAGPSQPPRRRAWRRRPPPVPGPFERIAAELVAQALDLDGRLIIADRRGGMWRRQALSELAGEVRQLEFSAHRMEALSRSWQTQLAGPQPTTSDLKDRLDALEAALSEFRPPGSGGATASTPGDSSGGGAGSGAASSGGGKSGRNSWGSVAAALSPAEDAPLMSIGRWLRWRQPEKS